MRMLFSMLLLSATDPLEGSAVVPSFPLTTNCLSSSLSFIHTHIIILHNNNKNRWHWRTPSINGDTPPGRSYHSAVVIKGGKEIVYFGGNDGSKCFQSVCVLQVSGSCMSI